MYLNKAYDDFIFSRKAFCSDDTVKNYSHTIKYFVEFLEKYFNRSAAEIELEEIGLQQLNQYSIYLKDKTKYIGHPFKMESTEKISSRTRRTYLIDMRTFIGFYRDSKVIKENILAGFRMPKATGRVIEPLTESEVQRIDAVYSKNYDFATRNYTIIHLLLDEGLRSSEVINLHLRDIDFGKRCIIVRDTKHNKNRVLPMAKKVYQSLYDYVNNKRLETVHDYVFCKNDGSPFTENSMKCLFDRLKKSAKIPRIYPHLLRHTFGSSFILGGGSLELLKHYMGHADIKTTETYIHIANNFQFCIDIYKLDEIFKKKFY